MLKPPTSGGYAGNYNNNVRVKGVDRFARKPLIEMMVPEKIRNVRREGDKEESSRSHFTYLHWPQPCIYRGRLECLRLNGCKFDCRC